VKGVTVPPPYEGGGMPLRRSGREGVKRAAGRG